MSANFYRHLNDVILAISRVQKCHFPFNALFIDLCANNNWEICRSFAFSASPVQYKITSGNTGGAFGIHNSTGLLFIACALDYEKIKKVSLEQKVFSGRLNKANTFF